MAVVRFALDVSYGQLAVFLSSLQEPFNDWSQKHVDKGFSWRPGSVAFRTLSEAGTHAVELVVSQHEEPISDAAIRVIEVPFIVPESDDIEVASISNSFPLSLPAGDYRLRCELLPQEVGGTSPVRLVFMRDACPRFAIVRADDELISDGELLTEARPASAE